jgi:DNA mismatch endonuclease (patch repair protein)
LADILTPEQRSAQMSRIRSANTKLEVLVRKALHKRGFRYRLGGAGLPGRPDIVLPKYRTVVFVHGCFWHGHSCPLYRLPKTRPEFWAQKIFTNRVRDARVASQLTELGWRLIVIWECSLRRVRDEAANKFMDSVALSIRHNQPNQSEA